MPGPETVATRKPYLIARADAGRLPLADSSVDLVFTSPPYLDARTYGIAAQRGCADWIKWMLGVVAECCRVSRGLVLINCAGVTRNWKYQPGPEGLLYEWWKAGGGCWRPAYWTAPARTPGSGGKQWLRADAEYVLAFQREPGPIPWAEPTANGHPPKWAPGGAMSNRLSDGTRVNQWGKTGEGKGIGSRRSDGSFQTYDRPSHTVVTVKHTKTRADGLMETQHYAPPVKANPGNVIEIKVGGGHLGHPLAHKNEAPFPVALAEWFIRSHCPPRGIVLDPFGGSGTTAHAAANLGRRAIVSDLRMSQCELMRERLTTPYATRRPKAQNTREIGLFGKATFCHDLMDYSSIAKDAGKGGEE